MGENKCINTNKLSSLLIYYENSYNIYQHILSINRLVKKIILIFVFTQLVSCNNESSDENLLHLNEETIEIYLLNNLNDTRGYCIDMMGYKNNADISKSLQAHSCYSYQGEISVDQGFDKLKITQEEFYIPHFKVCMESENTEKSSALILKACNKSEKQKFILQNDGKIQLKNNLNLCLTISEEFREGGGGNPVHLIRNLSLENCDNSISIRQKWGIRKSN